MIANLNPNSAADAANRIGFVLGTPLLLTTYAGLASHCENWARQAGVTSIDFTNTHIVTLRRHDPAFRQLTRGIDFFVPDGMPLIWCLNARGAGLKDRVYGPAFMRHALLHGASATTHYFLGGSDACLRQLQAALLGQNPTVNIIGSHHGYFQPGEEAEIVAEINRLSPDFIWVGLGTPKQQDWIQRHRNLIRRGVLLAVGFAFDVNAGTKPDAPVWMQRLGLTWVHRLCSEPRRLLGRYLKYNSLFLFYLVWDAASGRAFKPLSERGG